MEPITTTQLDKKKRDITTLLAQIKENLRNKEQLESLTKTLRQERDNLTSLLTSNSNDSLPHADPALHEFQQCIDALISFCTEGEEELGHQGKKVDKAIQSIELALSKIELSTDSKQKQHVKTPTSQARRSCVVIGSVGKRSATSTPSASFSVSASDSGSESTEHEAGAALSASKKAKKKKKKRKMTDVDSPFAASVALSDLSTASKLKQKRSLCLTSMRRVSAAAGGSPQATRIRSTVTAKSSIGSESSDTNSIMEKENVNKERDSILKSIGVLERTCISKKSKKNTIINVHMHIICYYFK